MATQLMQLCVAVAVTAVCMMDLQYADTGVNPQVQQPRTQHPEVLYGVDEESAVGTKVGRGLKLDAGLVERYSPEVLESVTFRFLSRVPDFVALSQGGQLKIVGRADRETICSVEGMDVATRDEDGLCQVRLNVAVQPMKFFDIIKVCVANHNSSLTVF